MHQMKILIPLAIFSVCQGAASAVPADFKPTHISRTDWKARDANASEISKHTKPIALFIIGHTAAPSHAGDAESDKIVAKSIQDFHMGGNKWADTGYHFMVGSTGTDIKARDLAAAPTCYYGFNSGSVCGAFLGCFDDTCQLPSEVTDEMLFAMGAAIAARAFEIGISELSRKNIKGFSELGTRFPHAPGSRIMQEDESGVAPIDVIAEIASQELAKLRAPKMNPEL